MEIEICHPNDSFGSCVLNYFILLAAIVVIIQSIYSLKIMCSSAGKLNFENYVILSGVIQLILTILIVLIKNEYLVQLVEFSQLIIILFITRRMIKTNDYLETHPTFQMTNYYNIFFVIFVCINLVFIVLIIVFMIESKYENEEIDDRIKITQVAHNCFSLFSSLILLKIGINIKSILKSIHLCPRTVFRHRFSIDEPSESKGRNELLIKEEHHRNQDIIMTEYTTILRIKQINIVCYSFFFTGVYKTIYIILKNYLLNNEFLLFDGKSIPQTILSSIIHFGYFMAIITPIVTNYIAFYYIIRNYFINPTYPPDKSIVGLTENDISKTTDQQAKADDIFNSL